MKIITANRANPAKTTTTAIPAPTKGKALLSASELSSATVETTVWYVAM